MKFDVCLMNPPYQLVKEGDGGYVYFLNKCINLSDLCISVNPAPALLEHQSGSMAKKEFSLLRNNMNTINTEIEKIDNPFDAAVKSDLCIVKFDKSKKQDIIYIKNNNSYKFKTQQDIRSYCDNLYLVDFENKLKEFLNNHPDNIESHMSLTKGYNDFTKSKLKNMNPNKGLLYVYFLKPNASYYYAAYKNQLGNVRTYNEDDQKVSCCYITFNDKVKANNALNYLKTDFVNMCIFIAAKSPIGNVNRYTITPYLDFSKSYTDEELFNMIDMKYDKNEIDKILKK